MTKEICGQPAQRFTSMIDFDESELREFARGGFESGGGIGYYRDRPLTHANRDEAVAIGTSALHGKEQRTRRNPARIILNAADLNIGTGAAKILDSSQELTEA